MGVRFTASDVAADTWFTVTLAVSDGETTSETMSHYVQVSDVPVMIPEHAGVDGGDMSTGGGGCSTAGSRAAPVPFAAAWMALVTMLVTLRLSPRHR